MLGAFDDLETTAGHEAATCSTIRGVASRSCSPATARTGTPTPASASVTSKGSRPSATAAGAWPLPSPSSRHQLA